MKPNVDPRLVPLNRNKGTAPSPHDDLSGRSVFAKAEGGGRGYGERGFMRRIRRNEISRSEPLNRGGLESPPNPQTRKSALRRRAGLLAALIVGGLMAQTAWAASPLVQASHMVYQGSFHLPVVQSAGGG